MQLRISRKTAEIEISNMLNRINNDIVSAMKSKDTETLSTLRLLKGAIQLEEINKKSSLEDSDIVTIIFKQIKTRKDSIVEFERGKRQDLVDKTNKEIEILNIYLPIQMTDEELNIIIDDAMNSVNAKSSADIGKIMGIIVPKVKGKADMSKVNMLIRNKLN
jgi:uncharacterized protein